MIQIEVYKYTFSLDSWNIHLEFRKKNVAVNVDLGIVSINSREKPEFISISESRILALYKNSDEVKNMS